MPNNNVVDRFNVSGQEFHIEPILDNTPIQGSLHGVTSNGVFEDKSNVPIKDGTKNFTSGGAFDFFGDSTTVHEWLAKVYGRYALQTWKKYVPFTDSSHPQAQQWKPVSFHGGMLHFYYEGGPVGDIFYCTKDFNTYTQTDLALNSSYSWYYANDYWIVCHNGITNPVFKYSTDGIHFEQAGFSLPSRASLVSITYVHDRFFLLLKIGQSNPQADVTFTLYWTQDFQTLTQCSGVPSRTAQYRASSPIHAPKRAYGNTVVLVDGVGIFYSSDNETFTAASLSFSLGSTGVFIDVNVVKSGTRGWSYYSTDNAYFWFGCVRTGTSTYYQGLYSEDGIAWSASNMPGVLPYSDSYRYHVCAFNGEFLFGARTEGGTTTLSSYPGIYIFGYPSNDATALNGNMPRLWQLKLDNKPLGEVRGMNNVNGLWIVQSQSAGSEFNTETDQGIRVSTDLMNWKLVYREGTKLFYSNGYFVYYYRGIQVNDIMDVVNEINESNKNIEWW